MTVTVYTKDNCPQCRATTQYMDKVGVSYETKDATEHIDYIHSLGFSSAPVVETEKFPAWSGFKPDNINALVA